MAVEVSAGRALNLSVLGANRRTYFQNKLHPLLLGNKLDWISEDNRIPAVETVIELVPENHRGILRSCIEHQQKVGGWNLCVGETPWIYTRVPHEIPHINPETGKEETIQTSYGYGNAEIDDLVIVSLEYGRFFDAFNPPAHLDSDKFLVGIEDYLVNDFWLLEELQLTGQAEASREPRPTPVRQGGHVVQQVLSFADLRMELHLKNSIIRIRAGWDKVTNNVLGIWFDPNFSKSWPEKWGKRRDRLEKLVDALGKPAVSSFWKGQENAEEFSTEGARQMRDAELHYWSPRVRENLGKAETEHTLEDLKQLVIHEHFRLMDVWLLTMALIRALARASSAGPIDAQV